MPYRAYTRAGTPNASRINTGTYGLCFFITGYDFCKKFLANQHPIED